MGGGRRVEIDDAGGTFLLEKELVVTERTDPAPGGSRRGDRADLRNELRHRTDSLLGAVDFLYAPCERDQMKMRVDESRENRRLTPAEHFRACAAQPEDVHLVAESGDVAVDHRDGSRAWALSVPGPHTAEEDEIGPQGPGGQSEEGSGLASLSFMSLPQQDVAPVPGLLQRISVPQFSQM
jgi:hypothetical protein